MKWFNLKTLIISTVVATLLFTLLVNLWSANRVNSEVLIENTLETNRVYAEKLSTTVDHYIENTFTTLSFSADYLKDKFDNETILAQEAERLRSTNEMFNSVIIVNKDAYVLGVSPPSLELKGTYLQTEGPLQALHEQQPLISKPYVGATKRLLIFISYPIFDVAGNYLGFVGGSIYIREENAFNAILGTHFYNDGSYVYVVDTDGRIIYHEDPARLNEMVDTNPVVQKLMVGEKGAMEVTNSKGVEMLAGYSFVEEAGWGIVSQRPKDVTLAPVNTLLHSLWIGALPLLLLILILVIWLSIKIAKPLNRLAFVTEKNNDEQVLTEIEQIPANYYETKQLKASLLKNFGLLYNRVTSLQLQSTIDPLTNLFNRRTLDATLEALVKEKTPHTIALLDLDKFKSVNDEFGHAVGDEVLQYLAAKMLLHAPPTAKCCRYGGEEFMIIFPQTDLYDAFESVEHLRKDLEQSISPCGRPVTLSAGIAAYPEHGAHPKQLIEHADKKLYQAKENGRNQILV